MDPVSCLYNFLSVGIICYFVIICFLIKKCCMSGSSNSSSKGMCKCYEKIYQGEITPSNHVIVSDGSTKHPISYLINQRDNEAEYVLGRDGTLYRNEACRKCCADDNISHGSCVSQENVFVIRTNQEACIPCSPSLQSVRDQITRRNENADGSANARSNASALASANASAHTIPKEFQTDSSEHIFTVEASRGSRTSNKSVGSATSKKSCVSSCSSKKSSSVGLLTKEDSCGGLITKTESSGVLITKTGSSGILITKTVSSGGLITKTESSGSLIPKAESSGGLIPKAESSGGLIPKAESSGGLIPKAESSGGLIPKAESSGGLTTKSLSSGGLIAKIESSGGLFAKVLSSTGIFEKTDSSSDLVKTVSAGSRSSVTKSGNSCSSLGKPCPSKSSKSSKSSADTHSQAKIPIDYESCGQSTPCGSSRRGFDVDKHSKSNSCVSPCGTGRSNYTKKSQSGTFKSPFKSPCGSPGVPCKIRDAKYSDGASPSQSRRVQYAKSGSPATSRGAEYAKGGSPATSRGAEYAKGGSAASSRRTDSYKSASSTKNVCTGSVGAGSTANSRKANAQSFPSTSNQKSDSEILKCEDICSIESGTELITQEKIKKTPSPILKNTGESSPPTGKDISSRVSIKENLYIISPEGIKSAPTFGKEVCDPCPYPSGSTAGRSSKENGTKRSSAGTRSTPALANDEDCKPCPFNPDAVANKSSSFCMRRKNEKVSADSKDAAGMRRRNDKVSADSRDSAENSRGAKSTRFSTCNTATCSSKVSSNAKRSCSKCSRGNKSYPSSSSAASKSGFSSSFGTTSASSTRCSKCSSKFSSNTQYTTNSSKTRKTDTSWCDTTCNSSKTNKRNYQSPSITTADIDDFRNTNQTADIDDTRNMSPSHSRCENLGVALATSSCSEIIKARKESTCEAIRNPSKDVTCRTNVTDAEAECSTIRKLKEIPNCPSLREFINIVDDQRYEKKVDSRRTSNSKSTINSARNGRPPYATSSSASTTVNAAVIHEISTKVQSCLQHARAIVLKIREKSSIGTECRKTLRVNAKGPTSANLEQAVKVNSNVMLNTKGITINQYSKVNKPFGKNPGIQVKLINPNGNIEKYKKSYKDLAVGADGAVNIRISSPCKSTPGKSLCISTPNNPCCTPYKNNTAGTQSTSNSQRPPAIRILAGKTVEDDGDDGDDGDEDSDQSSSQTYPGQNKGAVVVYKRPLKKNSAGSRTKTNKGECSVECQNCKKKTCPTSKYYKGRKKSAKLQVYNVTTSHFSQFNSVRSPYTKGLPIVDKRMYDSIIHQDRSRGGETYLIKRREIIQKIKGKCPWM